MPTMKIYVDESFQKGEMIIAAIIISDKKVKEAYSRIKDILNKSKFYNKSELKKSFIRNNYPSIVNRSIKKIIKNKSSNLYFYKIECQQHSTFFYDYYSIFLADLKRKHPNLIIVVDKFNGIDKLQNADDYSFISSAKNKGLQLADMAIDNCNI